MNRNLWLLSVLQGLFLTNNVTFIAINGLVGFALAPYGWMATLPVMGYVVGGAVHGAGRVDAEALRPQGQLHAGAAGGGRFGAAVRFRGLYRQFLVAVRRDRDRGLLLGQRAALPVRVGGAGRARRAREGGVAGDGGRPAGAVVGPNLALFTKELFVTPFLGAYLALAVVALLAMAVLARIEFPEVAQRASANGGRPLSVIARQPAFIVATGAGALGYGVMNLLMAATPLAMQHHGLPFADAAFVLEWHVIGMFAPGFLPAISSSVSACCPSWAGAPRSIWSASAWPFPGWSCTISRCRCSCWGGVELPVHRQHDAVAVDLYGRGERPGAGRHEFLRVRGDGGDFADVRDAGDDPGMDRAERGIAGADADDMCGPGVAGVAQGPSRAAVG